MHTLYNFRDHQFYTKCGYCGNAKKWIFENGMHLNIHLIQLKRYIEYTQWTSEIFLSLVETDFEKS